MRSYSALLRGIRCLLALLLFAIAAPAFAAVCAPATSQGTAPSSWQTYCWLDFTDYNDTTARSAAGQNFSYTLSDGATLSFNLKATPATAAAFSAIAAPSWSGAAVGNTAFLGIPNRPVIYTASAGVKTVSITGITITPPPGVPSVTAYAFVVADAESTDNAESLQMTTNGTNWVQLDQVDPISGSNYPTITGVGSANVTMAGGGIPSPTGGYIIGSNSPTTVNVTLTAGGLQGVMFAVRFASIRLNKQIVGGRVNSADQFKFDIISTGSGALMASGTSTGTGNGPFTAAALSLASGIPLTITEQIAAGSVSTLAKYQSRLTCTNGSSSSTTLPTNLVTTSFNFGALQFGDAIQCVFTNTAFPHLRLQKSLGPGGRLFNTDQFTVRFAQGSSAPLATTTTTGTGTTVTNGVTSQAQVVAGTNYTISEVASGTTVLAQYTATVLCTNAATASTTPFPATVPGNITLQMGDVVTCTIINTRRPANATLTIVKSSTVLNDPANGTTNPKAIPGAIVRYSLTVANSGTLAVDNNTVFMVDSIPANLEVGTAAAATFIQGTPPSNLSLTAANVRFSNLVAAPTSLSGCTYTPVAAYDPAVKHICVLLTGSMAAAAGAGQPNFTLTFNAQIK